MITLKPVKAEEELTGKIFEELKDEPDDDWLDQKPMEEKINLQECLIAVYRPDNSIKHIITKNDLKDYLEDPWDFYEIAVVYPVNIEPVTTYKIVRR